MDQPFKNLRLFADPYEFDAFAQKFLKFDSFSDDDLLDSTDKLYSFLVKDDGELALGNLEKDTQSHHRIWLISTSWNIGEAFIPNSFVVKDFMASQFKKQFEKTRDGFNVELYTNL